MPNFDEPAAPREQQTYDDFVAWRDANHDRQITVGDSMRRYNHTSLDTILAWWQRDKAEQDEPVSAPTPETREAIMEPRFEPTGNGTFRLDVTSATQTRTGPNSWDQAPPRVVTLMQHISAHLIAEVIQAGSAALADATYPIRN